MRLFKWIFIDVTLHNLKSPCKIRIKIMSEFINK